MRRGYILVLPAASRPSMRSRISRDPKILPIILEIWLPMLKAVLPKQPDVVGTYQ